MGKKKHSKYTMRKLFCITKDLFVIIVLKHKISAEHVLLLYFEFRDDKHITYINLQDTGLNSSTMVELFLEIISVKQIGITQN